MYSTERLIISLISVLLVMVSVIPHEVAHGWAAYKLGDPTAKNAGRLSFNPVKHLDPFGSVILPLIMGLFGGPIFAYAKPVPFNPANFKPETRHRDEALVALAGPAANFLQALIGAIIFNIAYPNYLQAYFFSDPLDQTWWHVAYFLLELLSTYVYLNLVLMCFNLIPLPPLDGSKVISIFLKSPNSRRVYNQIQRYSMPILLVALYLLPYAFNVDPVGWLLDVTAGNLYDLLLVGV